ncbi:MAG TPA: hypothetical protein VJN18_33350 [Polyangiaceae bacterium]|nr:hypothetical protein [Polyangiaceae bacterium]
MLGREVEVLPAQPQGESPDDKGIVLDVRVRLASGEQVDVEMQSQRHPTLREAATLQQLKDWCARVPSAASVEAVLGPADEAAP